MDIVSLGHGSLLGMKWEKKLYIRTFLPTPYTMCPFRGSSPVANDKDSYRQGNDEVNVNNEF